MSKNELSNVETECLALKKSINENHRLAQKAAGDAVERGVLVGELLGEWKAKLPHGRFESFVEAHFEGSARTAQLYMQAAKRLNAVPKAQRIALLKKELSIVGLIEAAKPPGERRKPKPAPAPQDDPEPADEPAQEPDEQPEEPTEQQAEEPAEEPDYGQCPNCAGSKWSANEFGVTCSKCHHPHGEPAGDVDEGRVAIQRSKTVKTAEALIRAFDDLHLIQPGAHHEEAIGGSKRLLKIAKEWK